MTEQKRVFRNEWKYVISRSQSLLLRNRLEPFLKLDPHAGPEGYEIRSLYFDDHCNSAYQEKLMGVFYRKKWRIRIYNYSDSKISLERKLKNGNYIFKEAADLTRPEVEMILNGDYGFLLSKESKLCKEFYLELMTKLLRPKVIVDYNRIPLIQEEGTVRITFDSEIAAAVGGFDIFDESLPKIPAIDPETEVLEVKYTEFLPMLIKELIPTDGLEFVAFSKYVGCYEAAHHITDVTAGISKTNIGWRNQI